MYLKSPMNMLNAFLRQKAASRRLGVGRTISIRVRVQAFSSLFPEAVVHKRGELPYDGSREYLLLPPNIRLDDLSDGDPENLIIASIRAHRNIVFGARVLRKDCSSPSGCSSSITIDRVCPPLLRVALDDASSAGEQVQALSTLHGLCDWVVANLNNTVPPNIPRSVVLAQLMEQDHPIVLLEAVRAIATGVPRPGHSVVGQGTFRDGQTGWEALAKEFVQLKLGEEARLYQQEGGELVGIESLADTQPQYLKSAGGAMARFFFL